jgi:hypothetical protein
MGYNPYRKFVRHKGDIAYVLLAISIALALVAWAAWPR